MVIILKNNSKELICNYKTNKLTWINYKKNHKPGKGSYYKFK